MAILEPPVSGEDPSSAESSEDEPPTEVDTVVPLHAITNTKLSDMMRFKGSINGNIIDVFVDCGSAVNFLHPAVAARLDLPRTTAEPLRFTSATGQTAKPSGLACRVTVKIQEYELTDDFLLLPVPGCDLLLGAQWLDTLGFIGWHFFEKVMMFVANGKHHVLYGIKQLPATEPSHNLMAILAQEQIDYATLGPTVPQDEAHCPQVQQLLTDFHMLFEAPIGLPPIRAIDHRIPLLPSASPVNVRPYRYPYSQKAELETQVNGMLSNGLICPSQSPFSSLVLLVWKKDKAWRFCVDYRDLNAVTIKVRFPIPVVDELLDELHGARYFTKLDLRAGYHQIRMCEQDIHKTAFRTHNGHYEFVVMPFGLSNAPSTFQALMNLVFKPLLRKDHRMHILTHILSMSAYIVRKSENL
ncbi:PREDICTED: enzymatic polyprotein-like [Fragaria vesca subsp. vesca]